MDFKWKVMISGFSGGGKSTLFRLLDGHPDVLGTQLHEHFTRIFYFGLDELIRRSPLDSTRSKTAARYFVLRLDGRDLKVRLPTFRYLLARYTYYHQIEVEAECGTMYSSSGSVDHSLLKFDFDFERFEREWKHALFDERGVRTPEEVIDVMYKSFFTAWRNYPVAYDDARFVTYCGAEEPEEMDFISREAFDARVIYIDRNLKGLVATRIMRLREADAPLPAGYEDHKEFVLRGGTLEKLVRLKRGALERARALGDRALVIDFESLILNTEPCMRRVADFLGLRFDPCLLVPSHLGQPLDNTAHQYVGKINDRYNDVLDRGDEEMIERCENGGLGRWRLSYGPRGLMGSVRSRARAVRRLLGWQRAT